MSRELGFDAGELGDLVVVEDLLAVSFQRLAQLAVQQRDLVAKGDAVSPKAVGLHGVIDQALQLLKRVSI